MISPSKVQHQQHKQPTRDNSDTRSHVRLQKGRKPLEKKSFYLDIKNHALAANLEAKIKDLGGVTELFLVKSVTLVASDRADKLGRSNCDKRKWGYGSGGSGGPPSLKSVEVPTPIATPPTPFGAEYPLSNSTNIRSQTAQRTKSRADAMLERALTQPQQCSVDPLDNAQSWGIPIWATKKLQAWLEKIYESLKDTGNLKRAANQSNTEKTLRVKHLKNSYIKFESFKRDTRPVFLELPLWPKLNFDGDPGTCPFDARVRERKLCKEESASLNKEKGKEMTRRPRATATRARRTEQLVAGYCEICRIDYRDLSKHVQSEKHIAFVRNDDNFLTLDKLINSGASVEAFLRANQVGQDCNLFPDGDRSLGSVGLEDDNKVKKSSKTDLSNFGVEEIKMVQCNGARRNLNLKLSSPHNLRTRAKHESGHLLRSKGSPWHEALQDKSDKFYDKLEGFTIKKRAKGTIWIEEDEDPANKCSRLDDEVKEIETEKKAPQLPEEKSVPCKNKELSEQREGKSDPVEDRALPKLERNDLAMSNEHENDNSRIVNIPRLEKETRTNEGSDRTNGEVALANADDASDECKNGFNGFERVKAPESFPESQLPGNSGSIDTPLRRRSPGRESAGLRCNGLLEEKEARKKDPEMPEKETRDERAKASGRIGKRSGRGFRGRPRLSVEERLIEDNRAYYKVEVLGNKLRSSTGPWSAIATTNSTAGTNASARTDGDALAEETKKEGEEPSSEKPVVVRFKRVRRSELSLLSDEAESFMFGEPKREEDGTSSEVSDDDDRSSVLPRETESEVDEAANLTTVDHCSISSSSINSSTPIKQEQLALEEESRDSVYMGRARKRRRTQAEMLLEDNEEYYTFETPGSRLRFQGLAGNPNKEHPEHGRKSAAAQPSAQEPEQRQDGDKPQTADELQAEPAEKLYPSKPSPEVEKMQFSFEAVPRSEPWYQTYQRQDEGAEFWHYFSEADERKPFLLPYEIDNFHETLAKLCNKSDARKKSRRGANGLGRSPRKSPRCHASTLAIMSTIIRKREQLQNPANLSAVEEEEPSPRCSSRSHDGTPKPPDAKSLTTGEQSRPDTDGELRDIAKCIDEMLSADGMLDPDDSFEMALIHQHQQHHHQQQPEDAIVEAPTIPRGPPPDLLQLLDNCHDYFNCLENSSCASSECGEGTVESPLKRRKRRKNRTGWPGIKMRKKLQSKPIVDDYQKRDVSATKKPDEEKETSKAAIEGEDLDERLHRNIAESSARVPATNSDARKFESRAQNDSEAIAADKCAPSDTDATRDHDCNESMGDAWERVAARKIEATDDPSPPPVQCETITGSEEVAMAAADETFARKNSAKDPAVDASENSISNDENHENAALTRQLNSKNATRKRSRVHDGSSEALDSRREIENNDSLYIKNVNSSIISRKNYTSNGLTSKKRQRTKDSGPCEAGHDSEHSVEVLPCQRDAVLTRKQMRTRKRQRRGSLRSELEFEDQNCKNSASIKSAKTPENLRAVKRRNNEAVSSETLDSDLECGLAERVSPSSLLPTTELQNRRSSIEFQPVVRMMKIEDQVDMDHSILSVTVASNRRLRSSSSPRSNVQPPAKRYKRSKGPFGRWIKNS